MDESTKASQKADRRSSKPDTEEQRIARLKAACSETDNENNLKVPQRKLSVFCRSFDVIASKNQGEAYEFRRTSSSPSVHLEKAQDGEPRSNEETSPCKKGFVNNCRSLIESGKFLSGSSPDRLSERTYSNVQFSKSKTVPLSAFKLPRVREDAVDKAARKHEAKHFKLNSNHEGKDADESVATDSHRTSSPGSDDSALPINEKLENGGRYSSIGSSSNFAPKCAPRSATSIQSNDLAKIRDSASPRAFPSASSAGRRGKYTPVDPEMSSHEDSSIGSDNEDEPIGGILNASRPPDETSWNAVPRSGRIPPQPSSSFSIGDAPGKPDSGEPLDEKRTEDLEESRSTPEKRQKFSDGRRSLSEGDGEQYQNAKGCRCSRLESSEDREQIRAFPSFTDARLQRMRLSNFEETNTLYRENFAISENELERRYIAFSIGLSTDRITLHRRLILSRRQRDLSERNFTGEIQKMQEDIQELSPLCTDRESMEKVEKVRCRLETIKKCVRRTCYAAETLGAVQQEQRVCGGVFIADKYLRTLRSRCENLATEIAEIKRILLMHNIVIEEGTGEMGDDASKLRYSNNRAMVSRRRASIATFSGPIFTQDVIKEGPRQRNSVSGRVTLITQRRPSLCSDMQRWENEKLNRTDSSSVTELRDISEQIESRRNSLEENNNLLRHDQANNIESVNCDVSNNAENEDRSLSSSSFLESSMTKHVEKQLISCIRKAEPLRITRNFQTWRPILWCALIFFLGFYANYITSSVNTCEHMTTLTK
ncbi:inositol 1,4,5-triphosphate receptor associated 2-like isoform X2 [Hylaeus anthracinus]|uniref:inositol 1,4,5-triphosphate receptor associated 2-like isoform X2 n=1 Tax=Hylaeus anthracinus TaxID=313031 RepID=UPI0023B9EA56|nr:inositol 1,4,5-triphosphate receptor associated 2-like isoform X2 [Hylaeus anthracinus]